jgi:hypothetical protein
MRRWEDKIKMDLRKIVWEYVKWMHLAQGRDQLRSVVVTAMNRRGSEKGWEFLD